MNTSKNLLITLIIALPASFSAQNENKYGETERQQILCKEALSVYKSYKTQKNYSEAYQQWEKACDVCPEGVQESLYSHGALFIKNEIKDAEKTGDETRKTILIDSLMWAYDIRMKLFPVTTKKPKNRCGVLGRAASDFYKFNKDYPEDAFEMFNESLKCLEANSSASVLSGYYVTSFYAMKAINKIDKGAGSARKARMLTDYLMLMEYCNTAITAAVAAGNEKDINGYTKAKANIEKTFIAIAQCEDMVPVLQASVKADPENFELKKKVLNLLTNRECTENELFLPVATAIYDQDPSASAAYAIGMSYAKLSKLKDSFIYMEEAVSLCDSCPEQATYLLKTGQIAIALQKPITARSYANQILALEPDNADAMMLVGDAIASASSSCDDGALGKRAVYWLAHDYYARVNRLSPELAEKASNKMSDMSKRYPTIEEVFELGLQAGGTFTVKTVPGCPCSGENTIIRVR